LEGWIHADLFALDEQYPSVGAGTPVLAGLEETEWYEATADGDEHALARVSVDGPAGLLTAYIFHLGPEDE